MQPQHTIYQVSSPTTTRDFIGSRWAGALTDRTVVPSSLPLAVPNEIDICPHLDALIQVYIIQCNARGADVCSFFNFPVLEPRKPKVTFHIHYLISVSATPDLITFGKWIPKMVGPSAGAAGRLAIRGAAAVTAIYGAKQDKV